ncbi:ThiF family adenylyltransferase [Pantoea agglomerans]|nr:ThiF family adenylyltransferase [Pantoea agglomerans]WIL43066.1 ThiF family adenylyltransferase [Pantoea agglomerans]
MFQKLVSHNKDLQSLVEKGYAVSFDDGYLIIRDIPYLDRNKKLCIAEFVCKMVFTDMEKVIQDDHQVYFSGEPPCEINGEPISNLQDRPCSLVLSSSFSDINIQRQFSNKPFKDGVYSVFADFFEKIESYTNIISGPAIELYQATPYTFRSDKSIEFDSVFKIHDTLTSRAGIVDLSNKFKDEVIAIIGLGGTGSYILDFMVKTPVKEIIAFDYDYFHVHNSFRSPGRLDTSEFNQRKADVYHKRYENFREGFSVKNKKFDSECEEDIANVSFAFVCVDDGESRDEIFKVLIKMGKPFLDVGMGLNRKDSFLTGLIRTTFYPSDNVQEVLDKGLSDLSKPSENLYKTNIQIGELNALNASLAVIKYKQFKGFYIEESNVFNALFSLSDLHMVTEALNDSI